MNRNDIKIFIQFLDMSLPPGGQIQKSIRLKWCTLIDFIICHKFAIHCAYKLLTGMMIFWFFSPHFFDISMPPGGQIHISILLKWYISWFATRLQFIVYVGLNYQQGTMIWFLPICRHVAAPWWPNTEINTTEMLYPDRFHDLPQFCNSLCM